MIKKIVIAITFVLVVGLCIFLAKASEEDQKEAEKYEQESDELRPLLVKKREIEQDIKDLDDVYEANKLPKGTTQVIYTGLEEKVYTTCYPIVEQFEYKGILAIGWNQLPGMEGRMSLEQFKELIGKGWETCIKWDTQTPVDAWWPQVEAFYAAQQMEISKMAYFVAETYSGAVDAMLQQKGMEIVFHHGEDRALIQTTEEEGLWHLGAVGLMGEKPKLRLKEAIAQKGNIAYLVGFELDDEMYDERSFKSMLSYFDSYEVNQEMLVMSMDKTRLHYRERLAGYDAAREQKYKEQKAALVDQLDKINAQIEKMK